MNWFGGAFVACRVPHLRLELRDRRGVREVLREVQQRREEPALVERLGRALEDHLEKREGIVVLCLLASSPGHDPHGWAAAVFQVKEGGRCVCCV